MCLKKPDGNIFVDVSGDSNAPITIDLHIGLGDLINKKYVKLKVVSNAHMFGDTNDNIYMPDNETTK